MNTDSHEKMVRDAWSNLLSAEALEWAVAANREMDIYQLSPEKHFDNARNREALQFRWEKGLHHYFTQAMDYANPQKPSRKRVVQALGRTSHALQDFYAHTNWIEIYAGLGKVETMAPLLDDTFQISLFPENLSSGFYSLKYGSTGCPTCGGSYKPPVGYAYCHEQIAKDYPQKGHGSDLVPDGRCYYDLAILLATRATRELWDVFHKQLTKQYGSQAIKL